MPLPQPMAGLIATLIGFVIPFVVFYFALEGYDTRFRDAQLFFSILVSLVMGAVVSLFHLYLGGPFAMASIGLPAAVLVITGLEVAVREVTLRFRRFRDDPGLPFYGLGLGWGLAAVIVFGRVYVVLLTRDADLITAATFPLFALTVGFAHMSLGLVASERPHRGWRSVGAQLLAGGLFNLGLVVYYLSLSIGIDWTVLPFLAALVLAGYWYFGRTRRSLVVSCIERDDPGEESCPAGSRDGPRLTTTRREGKVRGRDTRESARGGEGPGVRGKSGTGTRRAGRAGGMTEGVEYGAAIAEDGGEMVTVGREGDVEYLTVPVKDDPGDD